MELKAGYFIITKEDYENKIVDQALRIHSINKEGDKLNATVSTFYDLQTTFDCTIDPLNDNLIVISQEEIVKLNEI